MTNFEYYKDEFLKLAKEGGDPVITVEGIVADCCAIPCEDCLWDVGNELRNCGAFRVIWEYSEYKGSGSIEIDSDVLNSILTEE